MTTESCPLSFPVPAGQLMDHGRPSGFLLGRPLFIVYLTVDNPVLHLWGRFTPIACAHSPGPYMTRGPNPCKLRPSSPPNILTSGLSGANYYLYQTTCKAMLTYFPTYFLFLVDEAVSNSLGHHRRGHARMDLNNGPSPGVEPAMRKNVHHARRCTHSMRMHDEGFSLH